MKIVTWNVNSLRAREDMVLNWIEENDPDVLCMQETKVSDQEFPEDALGDLHYDVEFWGHGAYNGVAIAAHDELEDVTKGFADATLAEQEPRLIAATVAGIRIIDIYLPNGQAVGSDKYEYKLAWIDRLQHFLESTVKPTDPVLLCGDFNIAPLDIDVWDGDVRQGLFVSEPERSRFSRLLEWGFVDTFRHFDSEPKKYTWWDYRAGGWERNKGMRIDHMLTTQPLLERVKKMTIHRLVRGGPTPSDHVPVELEIE